MNTPPLNRFAAFADLTSSEIAALRQLPGRSVRYDRNRVIRTEGDAVDGVFFLHDGWVLSSAGFADGGRQVLKIHLPGDVMGAPSLPLESAVETLTALTDVEVGRIPISALAEVFERHPRLAMLFFLSAQEERVILMDRLMTVGRRNAKERAAALFLHLHDRLSLLQPAPLQSFDLPLNQTQIGDVLGVHTVHVSRVLREMEEGGLIRRDGRRMSLLRLDELTRLAGLPPRRIVRNQHWLPPVSRTATPGETDGDEG